MASEPDPTVPPSQPEEPPAAVTVAAPAAPAEPGFLEKLERGVVGWFEKHSLGGVRAALIAAGLGAVAGACFAISHAGFAAVLGLLATFFLWVAVGDGRRAPEGAGARRPFVELLSSAADLFLVGGIALEGAARGSVWRVLLAVAVIGLLLLLPRARADASPRKGVDLWSPDERRLVLLVSALFGHTAMPLLLIVLVGSVDLAIRLLRMYGALQVPPRAEPLPPALRALYTDAGRPHPGVRIATALAVILLLVLLPTESGWKF
ncbi:MAG: hypothetical protein QNJ98_01920 [Planctomycetota bacterium]|nr:hypothetical protein [Planctomycetota bacterium]